MRVPQVWSTPADGAKTVLFRTLPHPSASPAHTAYEHPHLRNVADDDMLSGAANAAPPAPLKHPPPSRRI
ncbi:MAG: hypothetical protein ABSB39_19560 [Candidatus Sulfotelmatobacter sp.]